jgi:hypothetical protein
LGVRVRNGDGHLKHFVVSYRWPCETGLAPVLDLLRTSVDRATASLAGPS